MLHSRQSWRRNLDFGTQGAVPGLKEFAELRGYDHPRFLLMERVGAGALMLLTLMEFKVLWVLLVCCCPCSACG